MSECPVVKYALPCMLMQLSVHIYLESLHCSATQKIKNQPSLEKVCNKWVEEKILECSLRCEIL